MNGRSKIQLGLLLKHWLRLLKDRDLGSNRLELMDGGNLWHGLGMMKGGNLLHRLWLVDNRVLGHAHRLRLMDHRVLLEGSGLWRQRSWLMKLRRELLLDLHHGLRDVDRLWLLFMGVVGIGADLRLLVLFIEQVVRYGLTTLLIPSSKASA